VCVFVCVRESSVVCVCVCVYVCAYCVLTVCLPCALREYTLECVRFAGSV
jgi:hypothetical protein